MQPSINDEIAQETLVELQQIQVDDVIKFSDEKIDAPPFKSIFDRQKSPSQTECVLK